MAYMRPGLPTVTEVSEPSISPIMVDQGAQNQLPLLYLNSTRNDSPVFRPGQRVNQHYFQSPSIIHSRYSGNLSDPSPKIQPLDLTQDPLRHKSVPVQGTPSRAHRNQNNFQVGTQEQNIDNIQFHNSSGTQFAGESSDTESADHHSNPKIKKTPFTSVFKKKSDKVSSEETSQPKETSDEEKDDGGRVVLDASNPDEAVVYAELDLNLQPGARPPPTVRPEEDKTEYAEIIHAKEST